MTATDGEIIKGNPMIPTITLDKKSFGLHEVDIIINILNNFKRINKDIKINSKGQSINDAGELILFQDNDVPGNF